MSPSHFELAAPDQGFAQLEMSCGNPRVNRSRKLSLELQHALTLEVRIAGAIHLSHPALPERGEDLEDAEAGSGGEGSSAIGEADESGVVAAESVLVVGYTGSGLSLVIRLPVLPTRRVALGGYPPRAPTDPDVRD